MKKSNYDDNPDLGVQAFVAGGVATVILAAGGGAIGYSLYKNFVLPQPQDAQRALLENAPKVVPPISSTIAEKIRLACNDPQFTSDCKIIEVKCGPEENANFPAIPETVFIETTVNCKAFEIMMADPSKRLIDLPVMDGVFRSNWVCGAAQCDGGTLPAPSSKQPIKRKDKPSPVAPKPSSDEIPT